MPVAVHTGLTPPSRSLSGDREGAQDLEPLDPRRQPFQTGGDRRILLVALEVDEEHVAPEALLARARLDASEVDAALRELRQAGHEPPRRLGAHAPEDDR